ncbi:hypothetical protein BUZ94_08445 [Mammaliicoccus sciuri]|uniref:hypothetical protein n=1 Tax=Mammaliicoccus sciuri TaxID=1296 RepID=UPI000E68BF45|nr:hypothetical protein [Mammaliicoccus sciuri]MEB6215596.1 hypothetical protein [Mammaliicoccus sciuri]MEB6330711.1 hypothetical protein [Mammaliicoccus sciuri]RIO09328.1 hypothetical protein BUZ94_08445 [Mammaliicoccus sciuri]
MNTNTLIEIPERYKQFRTGISKFSTSRDNKRIENNDQAIIIYFDETDNIEPLLFDKDIVVINDEINGTPFNQFVAEINFIESDRFEIKKLSNYVAINNTSYSIEDINCINIIGKVIKLIRSFD